MDPITTIVQAGQTTDGSYRSVVPPIYQSAIFAFEGPDQAPPYDYSRSGNPTRAALEGLLAELEGGVGAVATTTGMAAIATVLATLPGGAHVVCGHDCYGGTARLLSTLAAQGKLSVSFVDLAEPGALAAALRPETRLLWAETPSNPLLRVVDLAALADVCRGRGIRFAVDNTFLTPLFQRPLALGADLVVHSTTKYLNGHSDVVGGAVVAARPDLAEELRFTANAHGTVAQPFDSWLVLRGVKTLPLRLRQHQENAFAVARLLAEHPAVQAVYYPGLPEHPGHGIAARQQQGFGGVVSFELEGDPAAVRRLLGATRVFTLAESLGGVESLIEHPATMSHASMTPAQREAAGITDGVVRLSVGVEATADLLDDLANALAVAQARPSRACA